MGIVLAVELLGIWAGTKIPDPWLSRPTEFVAYWIGFFLVGPILFVVIASIRNAFAKN